MSEHHITVSGGASVRLKTAGKYCDRDIVVTAAGDSGGDPSLPSGYVRAGYIKFTGEQVVDTRIVCNQDTKIKCVFTREVGDAMYMYGVASSDNTASITAYLSQSGSWRFGNRYIARSNIFVDEDVVHTSIQSKSGIVAGNGNSDYSSVGAFETIGTLLIGTARNASGTVGSPQFVGKVILFEICQGDEVVQKLTPVVSTGGVYRFYDDVTETFFDSITGTPLDGGNL